MRKAFSMLELVVVMAILAVLAAVLFPVFGQALNKSHETGCASNVHQVYLAAQLYRQDNGDYPRVMVDNPAFLPYFSGTVLKCPVAAQKGWPSYLVTGSTAYSAADLARPSTQSYVTALIECRERRGPDLPVVVDPNHATKVEGYRTGEPFFLLARESGAVVRRPAKLLQQMFNKQTPMPCDFRLLEENL